MKNQPRDGQTSDARSLKTIEMYWFVGLLILAVAVVLGLSLTGTPIGEAIQIMAWIYVPLAVVVSFWLRRRKRLTMPQQSTSLDDVRDRIDTDAVRSVKASKGEVRAVKELRRQEPRLSLKDAVEMVKQL
ncbi:hypothetical protein HCC61_28620 [Streptomyces sp. HNM0575]|uniref:hypothetical protein n=1 Tax=Streptomyces sp. HNM0575 TaxID=2716338 RepID=UPI00145C8670|nr:hypothetical protein [Streptomyces sp. HNM0575]NLU76541.1 hypothetical protein [Streptomyces sp. HNM0575]